ncbi:aspartate/glutamate racemase family protein [Aureimonas populi]|uniref:Aspartate/glutamate racemase family protein n=1 Tax=Aureimonas populi TaxID=1701758 RepID=A0ABW5CPS7_9HYPH|nr:aspartate/glutamate racemase family protein [Aureimonas populi]
MSKRIVYQLVAPLHLTAGPAEVERRQEFLRAHAAPGFVLEAWPTRQGRAAIESDTDALLASPEILAGVCRAQKGGADAAIIGCFGDPALEAARESVDIPVVGAGEAAMLLALQLGYRFSVISPIAQGAGRRDAHVRRLGLESRYASTRGLGIDIASMANGSVDPRAAVIEAGRKCVEEDGADVLVLGCMSFSFLGFTGEAQREIGVPVVNPVIAALKAAETILAHGLHFSRRSWPKAAPKPHPQSIEE